MAQIDNNLMNFLRDSKQVASPMESMIGDALLSDSKVDLARYDPTTGTFVGPLQKARPTTNPQGQPEQYHREHIFERQWAAAIIYRRLHAGGAISMDDLNKIITFMVVNLNTADNVCWCPHVVNQQKSSFFQAKRSYTTMNQLIANYMNASAVVFAVRMQAAAGQAAVMAANPADQIAGNLLVQIIDDMQHTPWVLGGWDIYFGLATGLPELWFNS